VLQRLVRRDVEPLANTELDRDCQTETDDVAKEQARYELNSAKVEWLDHHGKDHVDEEDGNGERQRHSEGTLPLLDLLCLGKGFKLRVVVIVVRDQSIEAELLDVLDKCAETDDSRLVGNCEPRR